jgi:RNA polymerase sigma factor (TIGR02999 family)
LIAGSFRLDDNDDMSDVTRIFSQIESGNPQAAEQLLPLVYNELRKLAAASLAHEKAGQTLQATALVHEAWLRLVGVDPGQPWNSRNHFFAAAAEAMRRILVDSARRKASCKYGGKFDRKPQFDSNVAAAAPSEEVIAVHEALDALQLEDPMAAELVKLHYFGGFSLEEGAQLLGMSRATAYRMWTYARAWLASHLKDQDENA